MQYSIDEMEQYDVMCIHGIIPKRQFEHSVMIALGADRSVNEACLQTKMWNHGFGPQFALSPVATCSVIGRLLVESYQTMRLPNLLEILYILLAIQVLSRPPTERRH
jgi:hypothetical protein